MISWLLWVKAIRKGDYLRYSVGMVVHVQQIGDKFAGFIPPELVDELGLVDGSELEIGPVDKPKASATRYATVEETLGAFEDTLPQHEAAYRELAK